jgi:hypothetical protein
MSTNYVDINEHHLLLMPGGRLGFYYKEHEILPPLPGNQKLTTPLFLIFLLIMYFPFLDL